MGSALTKIEAVLGLLRKNGSLPLPESSTPLEAVSSVSNARTNASNPCYDGLLSFASYSGGAKLELAKMHECELGGEGYKLEQLNANSCGDGLFYNGIWGEDSDNKYYTLVTPTETYYVYRKINVSCRQYYAAKKSYWTGPCNLGQGNCGELWTRVGIPYGESTGEKAADELAKGFAATLATAGGLSALIDFGYGIAVAEALTVSKGDFAITFAITALTCTTCTEAQFIESFALNLAGNQVFKGIFVGLTEIELLSKARLYAAAYLNSVKQTTSYGSLVAKIGEFGNKVSGYWQPFLDKIKSLVQVTAAGKFTLRQIEHYVALATKQGNKSKVMLGKFDNGRSTGYVARAGTEHTFFDMGNKWDEAFNLVNKSDDEIWRINQKFIDNQKALGKEFYLSHDPSVATGFYYREVQYLTKPVSQGGLGGTVLNQGNNLWKIVW